MSRVNSKGGEGWWGCPLFNNNKMSLGKNKRPRSRAAEGLHYQVVPTKKENTHPHTQWGWAIVMSPLDYRQWQITWATRQQAGYLETRVLVCANVSPGVQGCACHCRHFYSYGCYCWPCCCCYFCCCLRVCKPCYYNNVQSEPVMKHWKKPCEDRSVEKYFTFSIN